LADRRSLSATVELRFAKLEIVAALARLRERPERERPFVIVGSFGGGAFVQFAGSADRPLVFDVPLSRDYLRQWRTNRMIGRWAVRSDAKETDFGFAIDKVSDDEGAELALTALQYGFGVSLERRLVIEEGGDAAEKDPR